MSTPNPEQPAPTPRTLYDALVETNKQLRELIKEESDDPSVGITGWNSLHELVESNSQLLASHTKHAGVRWSDIATVIADYNDQLSGVSPSDRPLSLTEMELANRLTALFPAPTPATSEDFVQAVTDAADQALADIFTEGKDTDEDTIRERVRQALRAAMDPEAQRVAIAAACGLTDVRWNHHRFELLWGECSTVPDYLHSLDAMHEAEKVLTRSQKLKYADELGFIVALTDTRNELPERFYALHATAAQRAEAFLRTLNLWTPTK